MTMKSFKAAALVLLMAGGTAWTQTPPTQQSLTPVEAKAGTVEATIDLGAEFPQMKGYVMAEVYNDIPPGAGKSWHSHKGALEIVRIISGTLTEARNGGPPKTFGPGSLLVNDGKVSHMWANLGKEPVVMVAFQVHAAPPPQK
jgi:quercetin dioxygenase-like cupin family protein